MSSGWRHGPSRSMMLVMVTSPIFTVFMSELQPVEARGGAAEQVGFGRGTRAAGQDLARVPERSVGVRALVHREVALEHAARRAERLDACLDVRLPRGGECLG